MLKIIAISIGSIFALIVAFVVWRIAATIRGGRRRDEILIRRLDPFGRKFDAGQPVSSEEIEELAKRPENRFFLFATLRRLDRADLIPPRHLNSISEGESSLAYWLMHPNEVQEEPEAIEYVETFTRPADGRDADFHVYRYRMRPGHWAAGDGWMLGVAGPMQTECQFYEKWPSAFARCGDIDGKVEPSELVDWYVGMLSQKGMIA